MDSVAIPCTENVSIKHCICPETALNQRSELRLQQQIPKCWITFISSQASFYLFSSKAQWAMCHISEHEYPTSEIPLALKISLLQGQISISDDQHCTDQEELSQKLLFNYFRTSCALLKEKLFWKSASYFIGISIHMWDIWISRAWTPRRIFTFPIISCHHGWVRC